MNAQLNRRHFLRNTGIAMGMGLAQTIPAGALSLINSASAQVMRPDYIIRMSSNENPYGPSSVALQAISAAMDATNKYGGITDDMTALLGKIEDVSPDSIAIGSGSGEILKVAGLIASMEPGSIVCADPTFEDLPRYSERYGTEIIRVPVDENMHTDLDAMYSAIRSDTKMVYLCNPNNPIPSIIEKTKLKDFVMEVSQDRLVFVDEAYYEYVANPEYGSMMELIREGHNNIIVSRTASKIHGLAGLRIGFGYAHPDLISRINDKKTGGLNIIGQHAMYASYQDPEFQSFAKQQNLKSLKIVEDMFEQKGIRYVKSDANFTFFETGQDINEVRERMLAEGILIGRPFPPFTQWARVSMQKPEEMQYFVQTYNKLYG